MSKFFLLIPALILLHTPALQAACGGGCGKCGAEAKGKGGQGACGLPAVAPDAAALTQAEKAGLRLMREEEKLAHDVYAALGKKWDARVFLNIVQAEQRHMNAVAALLERNQMKDPIGENAAGKFTNPKLQKLYNQLVAKGNKSLVDALEVGAEIEELDIADLESLLKSTKDPSIKAVYGNLNRASRNHLRAFSRNLKAQGKSYQASHLSQKRFDAIAAGEQECGNENAGPKNGQGQGKGKGRCQGKGRGWRGGR